MSKVKSQQKQSKRTLKVGARAKPKSMSGTVRCAFCRGTGKDPFGALSALSDCQVCGGTGKTHIKGLTVTCAFCKGTGMQPNTTDRLHCLACHGVGVVSAIKNPVKCPACGGTGHQMKRTAKGKRPIRQRCLKCNGQGVLPREWAERLARRKKQGMTQCAFCRGTSAQPYTTDQLSCTACGGTGEVAAIKNPVKCPTCDGTGWHTLRTFRGKRRMRQHCLVCKGQGVVASSVSKT